MKPLDAVYYLIIFSVIIIFAVDIIATKVLLLWFHPPPASAWRQEQDGRFTIRESWNCSGWKRHLRSFIPAVSRWDDMNTVEKG